MSQEIRGAAIGLTFQQVQKYERGTNRASSSRLYDLSQVLQTDVNYFFDEMPEDVATGSVGPARAAVSTPAFLSDHDAASKRETLELVRAYYRIRRADLRKRLFEITKAMAAMEVCSEPGGAE